MDTRTINEQYANIGKVLIDTEPQLAYIKDFDVDIIYLSSTHAPKKGEGVIKGQCEKIAEKYKWGIPADFTITIFEPNCEGMSDDQIKILIFHELLHVGLEEKDNGDTRMFIRQHDLEDFKYIINRFGTSWAEV